MAVSTSVYDSLNRRIATVDPLGRRTTASYDAADNVVSTMDATGAITTFIYSTCLLQAVVDPLGNRTSMTYDGRYSNKLTQTDALNNVTSWEYDEAGFLTDVVDALGKRSTLIYNTARQKIADQDQLGFLTTYGFDNTGRLER